MSLICHIEAHEILDSRGNPTVQATVYSSCGKSASAASPSGASKGEFEAHELRDNDPLRYQGKGVLLACQNITGPINKVLKGMPVCDQVRIDQAMREADGTENKNLLGANSTIAVSLACARLAALCTGQPLYAYLGGPCQRLLPCPMLNILNGGAHADNSLEFQEFMIRPHGFDSFKNALRAGVEVFHTLKNILKKAGHTTNVGDEGGFAPNLSSHEEALTLIQEAIEKAGYRVGSEISLAIDAAATEFYDSTSGTYIEKKKKKAGKPFIERTSQEQVQYLKKLVENFAIDSIEDGLAEHDWQGWHELTSKLGARIQLVGDDIFVTNPKFLKRGIDENVANAILIKVNQIGTLTETIDTIQLAHEHGLNTIISHRSGETEDSFIADLAVAMHSGQIKTGAPSRSERVAKYNRLLQIESALGKNAQFGNSL
jgi:enolase